MKNIYAHVLATAIIERERRQKEREKILRERARERREMSDEQRRDLYRKILDDVVPDDLFERKKH